MVVRLNCAASSFFLIYIYIYISTFVQFRYSNSTPSVVWTQIIPVHNFASGILDMSAPAPIKIVGFNKPVHYSTTTTPTGATLTGATLTGVTSTGVPKSLKSTWDGRGVYFQVAPEQIYYGKVVGLAVVGGSFLFRVHFRSVQGEKSETVVGAELITLGHYTMRVGWADLANEMREPMPALGRGLREKGYFNTLPRLHLTDDTEAPINDDAKELGPHVSEWVHRVNLHAEALHGVAELTYKEVLDFKRLIKKGANKLDQKKTEIAYLRDNLKKKRDKIKQIRRESQRRRSPFRV